MDDDKLFDVEYERDQFITGARIPLARHYDHENLKMRKPFIMWDGEGYTDKNGRHHYWLLANSNGDKLIAPPGRSIERHNIARLFQYSQERYPDAINVGFALGYDFTCILRSNGFANDEGSRIYNKKYFSSAGYVWQLRMGKQLSVYDSGMPKDKFILQDTWGFFQRSFVKALDEYFNKEWNYRDTIVEMKAQRSTFDREHDNDVMKYNDMELELGVELMDELRDRVYAAGLSIQHWYGPGALATGLMQQWKIKKTLVDLYDTNPPVAEASRYAYAGGRFELLKCGHMNTPVYQYDINSAYPWAIAQLPDMSHGTWKHNAPHCTPWTMYHVRATPYTDNSEWPYGFWRRLNNGNISYPDNTVEGWFWKPEYDAISQYLGSTQDCEILETWSFHPTTNTLPFAHIHELYERRQKLKALGQGSHVAIKLALNSLYGKMAQQVGWETSGTIPPYHNLAWAGWVTAATRGKLLSAMALNPDAIIATETDGIFSLQPLPLDVGAGLGQWELTEYDDMYYFASGFRFGIQNGEVVKPATRGIPVKDISLEKILESVTTSAHGMNVDTTQFISLQWGLHLGDENIVGQWKSSQKRLILMAEQLDGKRIHNPNCPHCRINKRGIRVYDWEGPHLTIPNPSGDGMLNKPHDIAWITRSPIDQPLRDQEMGYLF